MSYVLVQPDSGRGVLIEAPEGPQLGMLQTMVGGLVEAIDYPQPGWFKDSGIYMVGNEEARLFGLPAQRDLINDLTYLDYPIVGPVVFCTGAENIKPLLPAQIDVLADHGITVVNPKEV